MLYIPLKTTKTIKQKPSFNLIAPSSFCTISSFFFTAQLQERINHTHVSSSTPTTPIRLSYPLLHKNRSHQSSNDLHVSRSNGPLCAFIPPSLLVVFNPVVYILFLKHFCHFSSETPHSAGFSPILSATFLGSFADFSSF